MMLTERGTGNGWAAASVSPDDRPLDGHLLLDLRQPPTRSPRRITTVHSGASQTTRRASRASRRTPHDAPTTSSASRLAPRAGDSGGTRRLAVRRRSRRRPAHAGRGTRRRTASRRVSHAQTAASPTARQPHSPPANHRASPRVVSAPPGHQEPQPRPAGGHTDHPRGNTAGRLFRNASMPSTWSGVPNSAWNIRRSNITPSDKPPS
ncbi:MAG: hypothetical protein RLY78_289 [Pseudomonadota bacterium]